MVDVSQRKLGMTTGSEPLKFGAIKLDDYADESVQIPSTLGLPASAAGFQWGMLGNDSYGCCVAASKLHMQETFALKRGARPFPWSTSSCLTIYFADNDVPPGPPGSSSDQGTDPSVSMQKWQVKGLPGHNLAGFGVLPATSPNIRRAIYEFGAVMLAVLLPITAQAQGVDWTYDGGPLTGDAAPGSWGGHAIAAGSYTPSALGFLSWGELGSATNPWLGAYLEQVLVPLSHDTLNSHKVGPGGSDFAQMSADLARLR